jgi:hypothetical protein
MIRGLCTVTHHMTFGFYVISDCIEYTNESVCLLHQIKNTTCFGQVDHLQKQNQLTEEQRANIDNYTNILFHIVMTYMTCPRNPYL